MICKEELLDDADGKKVPEVKVNELERGTYNFLKVFNESIERTIKVVKE